MKRKLRYLLFILSFFSVTSTFAQSYSVKGALMDTLNDAQLQDASVTLIRAKDSILQTFTRSKQDGSFELRVPNPGEYVILITFPSFADYVEKLNLNTEKPIIDLGTIPMITKTHLLREFVLKQEVAAIKIKGDTTEYVADSFKVRDNASVEELLRKLPGIQVNKNGEITAQGEKVQKIMVDGEEFFTDDPAVVSKSLQAKAVDKVQVFDKKSEQAEFTGIDDGVREKTINLKLKDNMKKGYFGKAIAGGGTGGFYENQLMLNAFKNKRKLSVFGIAANSGKVGLGWEDRDKYSGGNNAEMSEEGYMYSYYDAGEDNMEGWDGRYNGQGLPSAWTGGLHYSNKWFEDALHLSSNYRYAKQNISTIGNTLTQYNLDSFQYYNDQRKDAFSTGDRHRADLILDYKIDSLSSLKLTANAGYKNTDSRENFYAKSVDTLGTVFNENERHNTANTIGTNFNSTLSYRKKFRKQGRTISATVNEKYTNTDAESYLYSLVTAAGLSTTIDQQKQNNSENFQVTGNLSYTEPLSKVMFLEVNYGLTLNNSYAKRLSYNKSGGGDSYDVLDSLFSSHYDFDVMTNKGGTNLRFVFKKVNFSIGGAVASTDFNQTDKFTDVDYHRNFFNFFPSASFTYRPGGQKSMSFNYNGSTQQPTIDQIQPLRQNTDPLNISIGNPDLKQEFNHNFNVRYNNYKVFTGTYTYGGVGVTFTNDDISRTETISDKLIRTYRYQNVDGNYNGWWYGGIGRNFRETNMRGGINTGGYATKMKSIINGFDNTSNSWNIRLGVDANYDKDSFCNVSLNFNVEYNTNKSTINQNVNNYFTYSTRLDASFQLPKKFEIGTDINWDIRQKVAAFDNNNNVLLWNAYISKKFLKGDALELRATGYDILNQNKGFTRSVYGNTFTQQNYNTIRRYGMLSLIWNFTQTAAGAPAESAANSIIITN
ncbi:MAG TPA: outer membrane beta-barrel family protein [Flavipsychrobacter sp.]|nr:outer membrane beta-barrel family protein [Flavipsychrobacter sp.]